MENLEILEARIGYTFSDRKLLERAVTHRSFAAQHNERLEFLGDSVLNCVVGNALFLRDKHFTEGELSRVRANLVCEKTLAIIAAKIDVSSFLRMGEGEMKTGARIALRSWPMPWKRSLVLSLLKVVLKPLRR